MGQTGVSFHKTPRKSTLYTERQRPSAEESKTTAFHSSLKRESSTKVFPVLPVFSYLLRQSWALEYAAALSRRGTY